MYGVQMYTPIKLLIKRKEIMSENRRKELFDLASSIANLTVLEYAYVKSLISTTKKSLNKVSAQQGDLKCK